MIDKDINIQLQQEQLGLQANLVSIVILTKNEERDLETCLQSIQWAGDVHILDSGSTDRTIDIAKHYGTTITTHPFESFGKQRNVALDILNLKCDWILFLDADEVVTDKFKAALLIATGIASVEVAGFYCCWKMMLDDKWLKYSDNFPKWQFRLMRKGRARFTDFGHGQKETAVNGRVEYLKEPYLHYGFSKGWYHWLERHNKYSSLEAIARTSNAQPFGQIMSKHGSVRNPALKYWLSKLPGWPALRFCYTYFLKLGFLEGIPGFIYCINMGYYEFLIKIKMREIRKNSLQKQTLPKSNRAFL